MITFNRHLLHYMITLFAIAIACGLTYWMVICTHMEEKLLAHPFLILASIFFAIIQKLLAPVIILIIFKSIHCSCSYFPLLWISMFSTAANASVPFPAGIPVRVVLQKKILDIPYTASTSGLFIELFLSYGCMIVVCLITSFFWLTPLLKNEITPFYQPFMPVFIVLGLMFLLGCMFYFSVRYVEGRWRQGVKQTMEYLFNANYKLLVFSIVLIGVSMLISLARIELLLGAMGVSVSPAPLLASMLLSYLAGVISFVPMGLGIRDASLGSLLVFLGIPLVAAIAVTAMDRIIISVVYLSGSIIGTHVLGRDLLGLNEDAFPKSQSSCSIWTFTAQNRKCGFKS
ncbi:MAG: flippase-like domain-containing protein [Candidatus Magnetomorum sp.]|nr:flippase-like domain-containing protein [Candidatus Magnetomorum sp.]